MRFLSTTDSIMVVLGDRPYTISSGHPHYAEIRDMIIGGHCREGQILDKIGEESKRVIGLIDRTLRGRHLSGKLTYDEGLILYDGAPIHNLAATELIKLIEMGHNAVALSSFVELQQQNPDPTVHAHLYAFLTHGQIPLTMDGHFLAYKAVRDNYYDVHSGRFLNSVGSIVTMPRENVDSNRDQTCSRGLHVCSFAYLPHFAHGGHVMICKVSPIDVVAIPADYNNSKMRTCRYEVVGEVTSYYQAKMDILAQDKLAELRWQVWYTDESGDELEDEYYTYEEALARAEALSQTLRGRVWVLDSRTNKEAN